MAKDKGKKAIEKQANALERLKVEYVPIDSIKPNKYNPNRQSEHDFNLLLKSMTEDGFTQPIVCQQDSREIVDGEHRWRAAGKLGYTEIPVVFVNMTEAQRRIATLRHNRARGSEDVDLSAEVLRDLQKLGALDWAQDSLQLDDAEMNALLEDTTAPEALAAETFGDAWAPKEEGEERVGVEASVQEQEGGKVVASGASVKALETIRTREKAMAAAKTEEEKRMVEQDHKIFRLSLTFAGEQATIVQTVLGKQPAEKLLALCEGQLEAKPA